MQAQELRTLQAPVKERYRSDPESAILTMSARGNLKLDGLLCQIQSHIGPVDAGLHRAAGGDGTAACSAEILLQSLAACAGVTFCAVATAMEIPIQGGSVTVEGDVDFRGTMGISKEVPVGFSRIRMKFEVQGTATPEQLEKLLALTERYCVIFQTLKNPPEIISSVSLM